MLEITDTYNIIILSRRESIQLEIKLNVSKYGNTWKDIGDYLYEYGIGKHDDNIVRIVSVEQYEYLKMLLSI